MNIDQLRAFVFVVDAGSMEAAARRLFVSTSAVSQRIRALESAVGAILLRRSNPMAPTKQGEIVLRAARQMLLVEAEARAALGPHLGEGATDGNTPPLQRETLRLAVGADALATWVSPLFAIAATWADSTLHIEVIDQDQGKSLLESGRAMVAISSAATPSAGCAVRPLGVMRYEAIARVDVVEQFAGDLNRMPVIDFGPDDSLQSDYLAARGIAMQVPPVHQVPGSREFVAAIDAGLGWGMVPRMQMRDLRNPVQPVGGEENTVDVPLYLHRWKLKSVRLDRLCQTLERLAEAME